MFQMWVWPACLHSVEGRKVPDYYLYHLHTRHLTSSSLKAQGTMMSDRFEQQLAETDL